MDHLRSWWGLNMVGKKEVLIKRPPFTLGGLPSTSRPSLASPPPNDLSAYRHSPPPLPRPMDPQTKRISSASHH
ncbi:hypothetical protein FA13DRAFT_639843 [Coprinellus micaceus]|uniref:Uncharacterized protein n=1 Tax=Coprinellus micaceus TaxID=71717 RepID=A0A4Y7T614_COPMI|nr:hypothetical protein FA13DRAFT_639843 [Coprinellus micaceus]